MVISNCSNFRKGIWKIQSLFIMTNFQQTRNRRKCSQSGKGHLQKIWRETWILFGTGQGTPALTTSIPYCIEGHSAIKQEKGMKDPVLERKKWNSYFHLQMTCLHMVKKTKPLRRWKITGRMNKLLSGYKVNMQRSNILL